MDVITGWRDVPAQAKGAVLAIGNFDGVHRGHQAVLGRAATSPRQRVGAPAPWCSSRIRASSSRLTSPSFA